MARVGLGKLAVCFHCTAFWISLGMVLILFEWSLKTPVMILGVAGASSITERWLGGAQTGEDDL